MRITSKGQVTIPIALREKVGLKPSTEIDIDFDGEYVRVCRARKHPRTSGKRLIEHMRGRGDVSMTTDEIMALMRGNEWSFSSPSR